MRAGRLNTQIQLLRKTVDANTHGEEIETWNTLATVWAEITPLRGQEKFAAMQSVAEIDAKVRIRYRRGVSAMDRVIYWGKTHDIVGVVDLCQGVGWSRITEIYTKARAE
jgi:SPP1 family predicted phage head-tail adaptor